MLIFSNHMLHRNAVTIIGVSIVIASCWVSAQGTFNEAVTIEDNHDELNLIDEAIATNEFLIPEDNEAFIDRNAPAAKVNVNDGHYTKMVNPKHFGRHLNVSHYPGKLCNRECKAGDKRVCYFEFTFEFYQSMGVACGECARGVEEDCNHPQCIVGDGVEKSVMSINRQIPGPDVQVCRGDLIVVDVHNAALGTAGSIHWHGLHMVDTPHMDGVPYLTQCPIPYSTTFRYQIYATEAGTHFYHSHSGHHKVNGQYGPLIVRIPKEEQPLKNFYDYDLSEHYIFIVDWMHANAEKFSPGLRGTAGIRPDSVVINGRGTYTNPRTGEQTHTPPETYYVEADKRYLFRLINSVSHVCAFQIQIEKHDMTIVASDSFNLKPLQVDTLIANAGERYDFILNANNTRGDFWIHVTGLGFCDGIKSNALISYQIANQPVDLPRPPFPRYEDILQSNVRLNHPSSNCWDGVNDYCINELEALEHDEHIRYGKPDYKFFFGFRNVAVRKEEVFKPGQYMHFSNIVGNLTVVGSINNISLIHSSRPPLTQYNPADESEYCDELHKPAECDGKEVCLCKHLIKVELGSLLQIVLFDASGSLGSVNHPFHLHGTRFLVLDMGRRPDGIPMSLELAKQMERDHLIPRNNSNPSPPFKDTVSIPSGGYVVIRVKASNPGFWLMHCHYEYHTNTGMGLILQVGTHKQMVKPPRNFPLCGNYKPPVKMSHL